MKLCDQEGFPWVLEPKFRYYHLTSKRIQNLEDLWKEEKNRWE